MLVQQNFAKCYGMKLHTKTGFGFFSVIVTEVINFCFDFRNQVFYFAFPTKCKYRMLTLKRVLYQCITMCAYSAVFAWGEKEAITQDGY